MKRFADQIRKGNPKELNARALRRSRPGKRWKALVMRNGRPQRLLLLSVLLPLLCGLAAARGSEAAAAGGAGFQLKAAAFAPGTLIPRRHTCQGADVSPALTWTDPPAGTKSFALIVTDPDAPAHTWVHWVIYNLPANARQLPEGVSKDAKVQHGALQGSNDFERLGYGGPCPPPGEPHRYFFRLYALNAQLNLKPGASREQVEEAMKGHILARAELMARYGRQ